LLPQSAELKLAHPNLKENYEHELPGRKCVDGGSMRILDSAHAWASVTLAFGLAGSCNAFFDTSDRAALKADLSPLVDQAMAGSDVVFMLAAATEIDRRKSGQLVAEAAKLLDDYSGDWNVLRQAETKLRNALEINPDEAAAYVEFARLAMRSANELDKATLGRAETSIRRALAIDPGFGNAYVLLGYVLTHAGRLSEADAAFVQAERAGATSPWFESNLAELRARQGQSQVAAEIFARVAAAPGKSNDIRSAALAWLQNSYNSTRQYDLADLAYRSQIELDPSKPFPKGNYSRFLRVYRMDLEGSESYARQALALMEYGMARDSLAFTFYLRWAESLATGKNPRRTDELFAEASRLDPNLADIVSEIGNYPRAHPILDALASKGITMDIMPGGPGGTTPLSVAADRGNIAIAMQMMQLGANPNTQGYQGVTPLMLAAQRGDEAMVRLLLTRGADPGLFARNGKDAEKYAFEANHFPIAGMLASAKRAYVRPAGALTAAVPFRSHTVYRVKKDFGTNPHSIEFRAGERLVFDSAAPHEDPNLARFNFLGPDGHFRELLVEKSKIGFYSEYFEEIGPAPAPPPSSR
jgi:tetratricopeptide (TPR) repeat protein